jgi:spermidine/putrescine-binding protein
MGATMGQDTMYATDAMANSEDADRMRAALPYLSTLAELPQTSNNFRNYVRYLKSVL